MNETKFLDGKNARRYQNDYLQLRSKMITSVRKVNIM